MSSTALPVGYTSTAFFCDYYELTMAQGYWLNNNNPPVVFDMFFRTNHAGGGYTIFAGIEYFLQLLEKFSFTDEQIVFLREQKVFDELFLEYLQAFKFSGTIYAVDEGTPVFPNTPLVRIHASLIEAQLIEGLLLNVVNFQSLIATTAMKMLRATGHGTILELGMRRAQGLDGALSATRAAYIGGAHATSNVAAAHLFDIPITGTMSHSWVQSYDNEIEAFRRYADIYPSASVFLLDTYDSLGSGLDAAIATGKILHKKGISCGVRLDSGDMEYLSKVVRRRLDQAQLATVKIAVSNNLTVDIIDQLRNSNCPIDIWGIGTHLITGDGDPALGGVYKMSARLSGEHHQPIMKISNDPKKSSNPGIKQLLRMYDENMSPQLDLIAVEGEIPLNGDSFIANDPLTVYHPELDYRTVTIPSHWKCRPLLTCKLADGAPTQPYHKLQDIQQQCIDSVAQFDSTYLRKINPHTYKVSISKQIRAMKTDILAVR